MIEKKLRMCGVFSLLTKSLRLPSMILESFFSRLEAEMTLYARDLSRSACFEQVERWLSHGFGTTDGCSFRLSGEASRVLLGRMLARQPSQIVISDRSGCSVRVEPSNYGRLVAIVDRDGDILKDLNDQFLRFLQESA